MRTILVVKGDYASALEALDKRIPQARVLDARGPHWPREVVLRVDGASVDELNRWFIDDAPNGPPFPAGSLLFWRGC